MTQAMKAQPHFVFLHCICGVSCSDDLLFALSLIQRFVEFGSFLSLHSFGNKMSPSYILCMCMFRIDLFIYFLLSFFGFPISLFCLLICRFGPYLILHLLDPIFFFLDIGLMRSFLMLLHPTFLLPLQVLQFLLSFIDFSLEMFLIHLLVLLLLPLYLFMQLLPLIFFLLFDHLSIPLLWVADLKQRASL